MRKESRHIIHSNLNSLPILWEIILLSIFWLIYFNPEILDYEEAGNSNISI